MPAISQPTSSESIILASASQHRAQLLRNAGLVFTSQTAEIDERAVEAPLVETGCDGQDIAQILAEAKALDVSARNPEALVIGCDQTLTLDGALFHKVVDMKAARKQLLALSGKTHQLNAAIALVKNRQTLWRHVSVVDMSMRQLTPDYIGRYLAAVGKNVLSSVGCYQIEGPGVQLFEKIAGDYFAIVGLPLLPLLHQLRQLGVIDG